MDILETAAETPDEEKNLGKADKNKLRVLPKDNDGGIYLYMTAFGGVARMNATPHKVTPDMSSSVRAKTQDIWSFWRMAIVWPMVFSAALAPFLFKLKPVEDGYSQNVLHYAVITPVTQILILSSVPKLLTTITGAKISLLEQLLAVGIGSFASTALVMMAGGVGVYPIPFAPLLTTVPCSWLVFIVLYFVIRPQFKEDSGIKTRFSTAIHVHNLFYVGGAIILLYTLVFRAAGKVHQRMLALLLPAIRFVVRKGLEQLMTPISPDLMGVSVLLAEFSVQSLVASMLPGLSSIETVIVVVLLDMASNFWRVFMCTSPYLKLKFGVVQLIGGTSPDANVSRGLCWPFVRASVPTNISVGSKDEDPNERFRRYVYNTSILIAMEIADIMAPIIFMSIVSIIHVSDNRTSMGLGPSLHTTTIDDIISGWKWVGLLSGLELVTALVLGGVLFWHSGVNVLHMIKLIAADNMSFLARMTFSKYVFILSILLMHSGTIMYLN